MATDFLKPPRGYLTPRAISSAVVLGKAVVQTRESRMSRHVREAASQTNCQFPNKNV